MLKNLWYLFIVSATMSCGTNTSENSKDRLDPAINFIDLYQQYNLDDPDCLENTDELTIDNILVRDWNNGQLLENNISVDGVWGSPNLQGSIVERTLVSHTSVATCISTEQGYICPDDSVDKNHPVLMPLCRRNASYTRNSYEGIAATSLMHLENAYSFYQRQSPEGEKLPSVNLFILPKVQRNIVAEENKELLLETMTLDNNLSYVDEYFKHPTFMIHPTKDEDDPKDDIFKANLWESSWALSHEFGHHILTSRSGLTSTKISGLRGTNNSLGFNMNMGLVHVAEITQLNYASRIVDAGLEWGAINEAFADLYGYYSTGGGSGKTQGLECFGLSRDVTSDRFTDGSRKYLNELGYQAFYSNINYGSASCQSPNYQSIHTLGAIIAHGLFKINENSTNPQDAGKKLIKLADHLGRFVHENRRDFRLSDLIALGVNVFSGSNEMLSAYSRVQLSQNSCYTVRNVFAGLMPEWNNKGYFSCGNY